MLETLAPGSISRILDYTQPANNRELSIQLEQDAVPGQETGFRFWLYLTDGHLYFRTLMSSVFHSIVPPGANDCCLWQRDVQKKKWRRVRDPEEDLITTWQAYETAAALTRLSVTNFLKEGEHAELSRQFVPDDQTYPIRWVSKGLTHIFGPTFPELSQYQYELIQEQLIRVMIQERAEGTARSPERPVIGFLATNP